MLLSGLWILPFFFMPAILLSKKIQHVRLIAFSFSLLHLLYGLSFLFLYNFNKMGYQFKETFVLFDPAGLNYSLALDGPALSLSLLTIFLAPLGILACWKTFKSKYEFVHIFLIQSLSLGAFLAQDLGLFFFFFEASLIPMFFLIGIWGGEDRVYAAKKFFIYTFLASVFMLGAIAVLAVLQVDVTGKPNLAFSALESMQTSFAYGTLYSTQFILFLGFMLALAVKTPMVPLHTWLPDAHVQAPTMGSVILAAVMLKLGSYGMFRFNDLLFPQAAQGYQTSILFLAAAAIVYGALLAWAQKDIKKLIAYSSVSHMGYIVLGLFSLNELGQEGALFQMISHGLTTGLLFMLVGLLYERFKTKKIKDYGGLALVMPRFTVVFFIATLSAVAVPLTSGFIGEFLILRGAFEVHKGAAVVSSLGVVLGAVYMLSLFKRVFLGKLSEHIKQQKAQDLNAREMAALIPLVILIFFLGLYPKAALNFFETTQSSQSLILNEGDSHAKN